MPKVFSRTVETHYEGLLGKLFNAIKTADTSLKKKVAEEKFFDTLCDISTDYHGSRAHRMVRKYNDMYENYRLEQQIKSEESD